MHVGGILTPEQLSGSDVAIHLAIRRGRIAVPVSTELRGFHGLETAGALGGRGAAMKFRNNEPGGRIERSVVPAPEPRFQPRTQVHTAVEIGRVAQSTVEITGVVRGTGNHEPKVGVFALRNPLLRAGLRVESIQIRESKAAVLGVEGTASVRPPEVQFRVASLGGGRYSFEAVTHGVEVSREKFVEATAEYLATLFVDPLSTAAMASWRTESDPATKTVDAIEGVSGWLQITVDKPLKELGTGLGLSPGEAAVTAGVSTNLILAPITGPLDKAESFVEAAGIILGLLTGGHALVLACLKPLLHSEAKRLVVRGAVRALGGSRTDRRRSAMPGAGRHNRRLPSDAQRAAPQQAPTRPVPPRAEQHDVGRRQVFVPQDAAKTRRQNTPSQPLRQRPAFAPKPPAGSGAAHPAPATTAPKRRTTATVVRPAGDGFLKAPPAGLPRGSVTEVDMPTARTSSSLFRGEHSTLTMGGVGFGTSSGNRASQAVYQHPGCLTGRCVPPGCPPCLCPCAACHPYQPSE